jgi:hypothetical protein
MKFAVTVAGPAIVTVSGLFVVPTAPDQWLN